MMQEITVRFTALGTGITVLFLLTLLVSTPPTGATVDQPAADEVYYVSAVAGSVDAACGSQTKPCKTIQQAVNLAAAGKHTEIRVAQGMYTGTGENVVDVSLLTPGRSISIIGGYAVGNWSAVDSDPAKTVIDGENARRGINIDSRSGSGSIDQKIVIKQVTIQNGFVNKRLETSDQNLHWTFGGGLLCRNNNATGKIAVNFENVVFRGNSVHGEPSNGLTGGGGAALVYGCPASLTNVTFVNNRVQGGNAVDGSRGAQAVGGGLFSGRDSDIVGNWVVFRGNKVTGGNGGSGRTSDNWSSDGLGAGASFQYNRSILNYVEVIGNVATGGNASELGGIGGGGGLFFEYASAEIRDGILSGNQAVGGNSSARAGYASGGGLVATDVEILLERLVIVKNRSQGGNGVLAGQSGGAGIYFTKARPDSVMNVTGSNLIIANNETDPGSGQEGWGGGGGIFSQDTLMTLNHVTLDNNRIASEQTGVAIAVLHNFDGPNASVLNLSNSIVSNHQHRWAAPVLVQRSGDVANIDHTLFYANQQDSGQDVHQFPGAPAPVINVTNKLSGNPLYIDTSQSDYRLSSGSAAIDVAKATQEKVDFEGESRPQGVSADVGADEFTSISFEVAPRVDAVKITWDASWELIPDADRLVLAYGQKQFNQIVELDEDAGEYTLTGLEKAGNYKARLEARDHAGGVLAASNEITFFVPVSEQYLPGVLRN